MHKSYVQMTQQLLMTHLDLFDAFFMEVESFTMFEKNNRLSPENIKIFAYTKQRAFRFSILLEFVNSPVMGIHASEATAEHAHPTNP